MKRRISLKNLFPEKYRWRRSHSKIRMEKGREFKQSRADSVQNLDRDDALSRTWSVGFQESSIGVAVIITCCKAPL